MKAIVRHPHAEALSRHLYEARRHLSIAYDLRYAHPYPQSTGTRIQNAIRDFGDLHDELAYNSKPNASLHGRETAGKVG